ncbi:sigma-70 family RNA polymerase sigma factor [Kitasatospora sp. NPDC101155]|uniref:sigma-70 family RNA polymerase sigma factor n=1 Tax=Kitasatospora sp. NPDC101155 TaxID=3364097 RepID=UPI00382E76C2
MGALLDALVLALPPGAGSSGRVDFRTAVRPLLARLPAREQRLLRLRFWEDRTQSDIADRIGVSQMHVSRLLSATLTWLREQLEDRDAPGWADEPEGVG